MNAKRQKLQQRCDQIIGMDMWENIFKFLETDKNLLMIVTRVCKTWSIEKLCSFFTLSFQVEPLKMLSSLPNLKCLVVDFKKTNINDIVEFNNEFEKQQFYKHCNHFKNIDLDCSTLRLDMSEFKACKKLHIPYGSRFIKLPQNLQILTSSFMNVIETDLLASQMPFLHTLCLEYEYTLTDEHLLLFQFFPNLINLALNDCDKLRNISNLQYSTSLQRLTLSGFDDPRRTAQYGGLSHLTNLIWLDMSMVFHINMNINHVQKLVKLQTLILHDCEDFDINLIILPPTVEDLYLVVSSDGYLDFFDTNDFKFNLFVWDEQKYYEKYFQFKNLPLNKNNQLCQKFFTFK